MGEAAKKAIVFELTGEMIVDAGDKVDNQAHCPGAEDRPRTNWKRSRTN
ncbi:MAG: hypothetical protein M0C28_35070 [Candidatus Moduliflexus flocculans]|nr:hypothetical protein [Candidatus Moduliflexus flocculans]